MTPDRFPITARARTMARRLRELAHATALRAAVWAINRELERSHTDEAHRSMARYYLRAAMVRRAVAIRSRKLED